MTKKIICALWDGKDLPRYSANKYDIRYVENLRDNSKKFCPDSELIVLCDDLYSKKLQGVPGIVTQPIGKHCGGWSPILTIFHPSYWPSPDERMLLVGLDTVFVGDCDWLFKWSDAPVGLPLDPGSKVIPCDAVVSYNLEGAQIIWNAYQEALKTGMKEDYYMRRPSEMALLRRLHKQLGWPTLETKATKLLSYKWEVIKKKMDWKKASVVYFHGVPKPAELPEDDPIRRIWSCKD